MARNTITIYNEVLVKGNDIPYIEDDSNDELNSLLPQKIRLGKQGKCVTFGKFHPGPTAQRHNAREQGTPNSKERLSGSYIRKEQVSTPDKNVSSSPMSATTPTSSSSIFTTDFDLLFENPDDLSLRINPAKINLGSSLDEGVYTMYSFDSGNSRISESDGGHSRGYDDIQICTDTQPVGVTRPKLQNRPSRVDSIMEQSVTQMLIKNWESSRGLIGFRRKLADEINHKYCSYCRCDEMIFIFLYVVFGMTYICAGTLGLTECNSEQLTNIFLIVDGIFSVFIFPVTIMEWSKRVGGCVKEEKVESGNVDRGYTFYIILFLRISAAVSGTAILILRFDHFPRDDVMCWSALTLLQIGVILEWAFMLFAMLLPYLIFSCCYLVARKL